VVSRVVVFNVEWNLILNRRTIALVLTAVGIVGILAFPIYAALGSYNPTYWYGLGSSWNPGMMGQRPRTGNAPISFDEAVTQFQNYITSIGNNDLALLEVMEFENNFYATVYEKSTGTRAFELLIWKQAPSSRIMGGGMGMGDNMMQRSMMAGVVVPEPGPNMMWNTKYSMMRGMMGVNWQSGTLGQMPLSERDARSIAESYLPQRFPGAHVEGIARFYGYYTIDFEQDGRIIGMLSVNGYSGDVWYHSWHGGFVEEKEFV
jgi:hypothetical protein